MLLYKYVTAKTLLIILKSGNIRVQNPYAWNDPFEMSVFDTDYIDLTVKQSFLDMLITHKKAKLGILTRNDIEHYSEKNNYSKAQKCNIIVNNITALSLSETKYDLLMWAHYANNHEGCVIEIDSDNPFFENQKFLFKVKYDSSRYSKPIKEDCVFLDRVTKELQNGIPNTTINEFRDYSVKSLDWHYEKEWRLICNKNICYERDNICLLKIPFNVITNIYCGCRIKKNNANQIFAILKMHEDLHHIGIFKTALNQSAFSLDFQEFDAMEMFTGYEKDLCLKSKITAIDKLWLRLFNGNSVFLLLKQEEFEKLLPYWREKLINEYLLEEKNSAEQKQEYRELVELEKKIKHKE